METEEEVEATAVTAELECRGLTQEQSEEDDGWETDEIDGEDVEMEELVEVIETIMVLATDKDV